MPCQLPQDEKGGSQGQGVAGPCGAPGAVKVASQAWGPPKTDGRGTAPAIFGVGERHQPLLLLGPVTQPGHVPSLMPLHVCFESQYVLQVYFLGTVLNDSLPLSIVCMYG